MGDGFAVELSEGTICAPFDGTVIMTYPTGHAIGLRSTTGQEVLLHIGMDTVELNGKGFKVLVQADESVTAGQPLIKVDLDEIRKAGKSLVSPCIFTSGEQVVLKETKMTKAGDEILKNESKKTEPAVIAAA